MVVPEQPYEKGKRPIVMPHPVEDPRYRDACLSKCEDLSEENAKIISSWLATPKNFLFIYSEYGIGKTYLVSAIANRRYSKNLHTYFINESKMLDRLKSLEQEDQDASWYMQELCGNKFMIWDDYAATVTNAKNHIEDAWRKKILYSFIENRYNSQFPTIITSNYTIPQLAELVNGRIGDRLLATENVIIKLDGENKRQMGL